MVFCELLIVFQEVVIVIQEVLMVLQKVLMVFQKVLMVFQKVLMVFQEVIMIFHFFWEILWKNEKCIIRIIFSQSYFSLGTNLDGLKDIFKVFSISLIQRIDCISVQKRQ